MNENIANAVLIQNVTLADVERIIDRAIAKRMQEFYENLKEKPDPLIKRVDAAKLLGVSLPTLDAYGKHGILHPKHCGGRIYFAQSELNKFKFNNKNKNVYG